jgi:phage shock protein A
MKHKVSHNEAVAQAKTELNAEDVEDRFTAMEKADRIEALLAELKAKRV